MRILHTSDWHLGHSFCGRRREAEFEAFFDWLVRTIEEREVNVLLVAGDVFDHSAPSPASQNLYYGLLGRLSRLDSLRHVVAVAGNHDSPLLLEAPAAILRALDIHVVGTVDPEVGREILTLRDRSGRPELLAVALPYPRDREFRRSSPGESFEDKERLLAEAVGHRYARAAEAAEAIRRTLPEWVPLVGLGHLFTAGGRTVEDDRVRKPQSGGLGLIPPDLFPPQFDYLALGHLHQAQMVGDHPFRRYSGAPLTMSFKERRAKSVTLAEFPGREVTVLEIPPFRKTARLEGDWPAIAAGLDRLAGEGDEVWLEVEYTGREVMADLRAALAGKTENTRLDILRVRDRRRAAEIMAAAEDGETVEALDEEEVFRRCLDGQEVPEEQRPELWAAYREILLEVREGSADEDS